MSTDNEALPPLPLSEDEVRRLWDKACRTVTVQGGGNDVLVFADYLHSALSASPQAPAAQQEDAFERGRQLGMQQERALWQLAASSQEMERSAPPAQPQQAVVQEPHKGRRYDAGEWSMRNYEAWMEDQAERGIGKQEKA